MKALLPIGACLLIATGCGSRATPEQRVDPTNAMAHAASLDAVHIQSDAVSVVQGGAAPSRMAELLRAKPEPEAASVLPDLGTLSKFRSSSVVATTWVNGSAEQDKANGVDQATSLRLVSTANEPAWALYALGGTQAAYQLQHLQLETSNGGFSGDLPGYWVAIADYGANRWRILDRSTSGAYSFGLAGNDNYLSSTNTVYAAVLISDGQSVTVNRIGLAREESIWQTIQLGGSGAGVTPAIDFGPNNNPSVVWANSGDGTVTYAICDRSLGFGNLASWIASVAEPNPTTASQNTAADPISPNAKAQWLDLVVDPVVGMPRISMLYTGLAGTYGNSRFGITVMADLGSSVVWKNWRINTFTPDANYSSLARNPLNGSYAAVWTADTRGLSAAGKQNDMVLRDINWADPVQGTLGSAQIHWGFGTNWLFPHIRFRSTGNPTVAVGGGYIYYQNIAGDPATWGQIHGEAQSLTFGSLAYAGPNSFPRSAYTYLGIAGTHAMRVAQMDSLGSFTPLTVESKLVSAVDALGESNQIAYLPSGSACIAYTERSAAGVAVKYAQQNGNSWIVETVSPVLSTPAPASDLIFLDLAVDSNGIPAVCWEQQSGATTSMMAALRGS